MSAIRRFVRREIIAREATFVARVLSAPKLLDFDSSALGAPTWVVDLDVGGNRPVRNVPVKASGSGSRFYAQKGQAVEVRRTALGRLFVIGPGDVSVDTLQITTYALDALTEAASVDQGFVDVDLPFEYYQGTAMKGNPNVTFAVEAGDDSITRAAGSWIDDGFANGDSIVVQESAINDATLTITGITATVLTVAETLLDEGPTGGVAIGVAGTSRWNDAVAFWPYFETRDADGNPV